MTPDEFPEPDWKLVKAAYDKGLDRFCLRALQEAEEISKDKSLTLPERFRKLNGHMRSSNKELGQIFDDTYRRSRAVDLLFMLRDRELMSQDELRGFSAQTYERIEHMLEAFK